MSAYPYNPENDKPECVVRNEHHDIDVYYNKYKCIIPKYAPFYKASMVIKDLVTGQFLLEGIDFYFGHKFLDATEQTGMQVFGSIFFIDVDFDHDIEFTEYSTLGGSYNLAHDAILRYLATDFEDPRNCTWSDVAKLFIDVPPKYVPSDFDDAVKNDPVTGALDRVRIALHNASTEVNDNYDKLEAAVNQLQGQIEAWKIETHPDHTDHPHDETYQQVGALGIQETAHNALTAYGRSLASLTDIINRLGITQEDLDKYALLRGFTMTGDLVLASGVKLLNHNGRSFINIDDGNINVIIDKSVTINADNGKKSDGRAAMIEAGCNYLAMESTGNTVDSRTLVYNGHFLVTAGNIAEFLPTLDPGQLRLHTRNSDTVTLYGNGHETNPLFGNVSFPLATSSKLGYLTVTDSLTLPMDNIALSSKATHALSNKINGKLKVTQMINNIPLSSNVVLSKGTFSLGSVENVADADMPNSTAFTNALETKSNIDHRHTAADLGDIPHASETVKGLFRLITDYAFENKTDAADSGMYMKYMIMNSTIENGMADSMPVNALEMSGYGDCSGYTFIDNNQKIQFPETSVVNDSRAFYIPEQTIDITECKTHANFIRNKKLYFGVYRVDSDYRYVYGCEPLDSSRWGGLINIGDVTFSDVNFSTVVKSTISNKLFIPDSKELLAHIGDRNAHDLDNGRVTLGSLGLDNFETNYLNTITNVSEISTVHGLVPCSIAKQAIEGGAFAANSGLTVTEVTYTDLGYGDVIQVPAGTAKSCKAIMVPVAIERIRGSGLVSEIHTEMVPNLIPPVVNDVYARLDSGGILGARRGSLPYYGSFAVKVYFIGTN